METVAPAIGIYNHIGWYSILYSGHHVGSVLPIGIQDGINESSPENPVQIFCKVRDQWLVDGEGIIPSVISNNSGTPFGYIHRLLNYGMVGKKNMTTCSRIRWPADNRTLYFDG